MRVCSRCKLEKSDEYFNFKNKAKGLKQYHCKDCSRLYVKSHYEKNKEYYLQKAFLRNKKIKNEIRMYIWTYLNDHPCLDCSETDPIVLEFDHVSDKIAAISEMPGEMCKLS